jgi:hypothetical protein
MRVSTNFDGKRNRKSHLGDLGVDGIIINEINIKIWHVGVSSECV